jgi:hypothetical protein
MVRRRRADDLLEGAVLLDDHDQARLTGGDHAAKLGRRLEEADSPEPDGTDAQAVSTTATARVMAGAIRNLPTPAIADPCAVDDLDALTLAPDRAAVVTAST